ARVVAILLATAGVAAGGEDVSVARRADPDVGPRRRNRERSDPAQAVALDDRLPARGAVREAPAGTPAADPGFRVGHVAQAGEARRSQASIRHASVSTRRTGPRRRARSGPDTGPVPPSPGRRAVP